MVAGLICKGENFNWITLIIASIAGALTSAGGNVINDYYDYDIDKINRPERVLPSGCITKNNALIYYFFLLVLITLLIVKLNILSIIIVIFANLVIYFYSYKLKKIVLVGNFTVSFFTGLAFVYGGTVTGNIKEGLIPAIFAFLINFIREIIKDTEDADGDYLNGVVTFPVLYGLKQTRNLVLVLGSVLAVSSALPYLLGIYKIEYFLIIVAVFNPLLIYSLILFNKHSDIKVYGKVSMLLKIMMVIGVFAIYIGFK